MPVILAGRRREMRRNSDELRTFEREDAIQLGEADVVTDREPDLPVLRFGNDGFLARLFRLGLPVDDAADLDVEEVDLAIKRDDLTVGVEDEARVGERLAPLAPLGDRAADECYAVPAGPLGHGCNGLAAFERLGRRV